MFRNIGIQYIRSSVAVSSERTYLSGFRSWSTFRCLIQRDRYLRLCDSEEIKLWALLDFAAWCSASEGNQACTISRKLAAVQYFHRVEVGVELPTRSPLIKSALQGISRSHALAGTASRGRLPMSWDMLLGGRCLVPSWGVGGRVMWLCLGMSYFVITLSDEVFASSSGAVHPAHCITRGDVAFYSGDRQLGRSTWKEADRGEVRFRGHKGDQAQAGSVLVPTRCEVTGPRSGLASGGGAVALMVELLS